MNPLMMMIQMAQRGRNPLGALQQMGAGPQLQQMQQMLAGKDYNQLLQMADNAARERGTTVEQMAQQLGLFFRLRKPSGCAYRWKGSPSCCAICSTVVPHPLGLRILTKAAQQGLTGRARPVGS